MGSERVRHDWTTEFAADLLYIFRDDTPTAGKPGQNLKPCREWLAELDGGAAVRGELIVPNPFTGEEADTTDGKPSYIAQAAIARFPFIVVEFDAMPLSDLRGEEGEDERNSEGVSSHMGL